MLKLKLQYLGHLMRTADSLEKTLTLGKIEGRRRKERQRIRWITDAMDMNLGKFQEMVKDREAWRAVVHGVVKSWPWRGAWTMARLQSRSGDTNAEDRRMDTAAAGGRRGWAVCKEWHAHMHYHWKIDGQWEFTVRFRELVLGLGKNLVVWGGRWEGYSSGRGHG